MTGLRKQTNTEWAIDLIAKVPVIKVNARVVSLLYRHSQEGFRPHLVVVAVFSVLSQNIINGSWEVKNKKGPSY